MQKGSSSVARKYSPRLTTSPCLINLICYFHHQRLRALTNYISFLTNEILDEFLTCYIKYKITFRILRICTPTRKIILLGITFKVDKTVYKFYYL